LTRPTAFRVGPFCIAQRLRCRTGWPKRVGQVSFESGS
jgi:hypothetical protein